jgi:hypothetical protein
MGICSETGNDIRVLQQIILGFREELSEQGGFPRPARTCENQP